MLHPYFVLPRPVVIGHRGCAGEAPENTLVAFELGLKQGAAILESDVQLSRDGVPLLSHDPDVDRMLVNIFGGILRCDIAAEGIVQAYKDTGSSLPLAVRMLGTNVEQGKTIL